MEITQRHQFSLVKDDDLFGDALNFIQDVAAHEHRTAQLSEFPYHVHDGGSGQRVASLQRLIQNDEFRVVDQSMSDFGSLPHAL